MNVSGLKTRIKNLRKQMLGNCPYPAPLFFDGDEPNLDELIKAELDKYRKQGFSEKLIKETPIFIMDELAD